MRFSRTRLSDTVHREACGEIALIRAHHLIRRHFAGDLKELRATLQSLADLVLDIEQHETMAELDEDEQLRRLQALRAQIEKDRRLTKASKEVFDATLPDEDDNR